ncbi:type VII secretion protein EccB [Amycolatopsis oliviviridis]|uniref:Type VII secretion protein EccB n=1 Tax=Amycolatopsis oliviviridis TaxID=1471590 RepID=A0ABQ3LZR5_9PSEU|nr:type VII secretion protein EccB [Amycolatopsis oliviviridis]GHH28365.1 type VII secretion protein EccB [Amycolatopsis oliviviridis]
MKSRKDQVQAYFFVVGRLAAAVTHGKPDILEAPSKRMTTGTVLGFVLAAVITGIFGIYGMFVPPTGNTAWRQEGAIVMDKVSGARYVYLGGQLRPVPNYSSARLVSGTGEVTSVAPGALAGTTVGQPIGIPDAPDSLPAADKLNPGPWSVCLRPADIPVRGQPAEVTLLLGGPGGEVLGDDKGLLVSVPGGKTYLVAGGKRFWVPGRSAIAALGYSAIRPLDVTSNWLNTIPQGADLNAPAVPGTGETGPVLEGRQSLIGQVYQVRNTALGTEQIYVVRRDGLAAISRTVAALLLAAPTTRQAYPDLPVEPIQVGPAALTGVPITAASGLPNDLPPVPPEIVTPPVGTQSCVRHTSGGAGDPNVVTELLPGDRVTQVSAPLGKHQAGKTADRISIPAGGGLLARNRSASGTGGVIYLVTEVGKKYALADEGTITALGYTEGTAVTVDGQLLNLLPTGPVLSVGAARETQAVQQ